MPILTQSGRVAIAEAISLRPLHLAWGSGDGAWLVPPAENNDATALQAEVGRRTVTTVEYVVPVLDEEDPAEIEISTGRFNLAAPGVKTNHLLLTTSFDFVDAVGAQIRELAIFAGTTLVAGLPPGQQYFTPAQVLEPGRLVYIEHIPPIFRSSVTRETFKLVITI